MTQQNKQMNGAKPIKAIIKQQDLSKLVKYEELIYEKIEYQMENAQQMAQINNGQPCLCESCLQMKNLEVRLDKLEEFLISYQSKRQIVKRQVRRGAAKIRRKANQISRKYKCKNFQGCKKAYGTKSAIKLHMYKVHNIPKHKIIFLNDQIHIRAGNQKP